MSPKVAIVGAGMGGLAAALGLAGRPGWEIKVLEASSSPGGKVGVTECEGVALDTGPSLLTLPSVVKKLFEEHGRSLESALRLVRPDPVMRYRFGHGRTLEIRRSLEATRRNIRATLGCVAAEEFEGFIDYCRRIWEAAAPHFVFGPAPRAITAVKLGVTALRDLMAIDATTTMVDALNQRVTSPELRQLFLRYATFNGSDPRCAPATLHCIGWVDMGLGGRGVRGGMFELTRALVGLAEDRGVAFHYDSPVQGIRTRGRRFEVDVGDRAHVADAVVVNACVRQLTERLWAGKRSLGLKVEGTPSMSAWTAIVRARRRPDRPAHAVFFPRRDYQEEFSDIFDRGILPREPAIYVCAYEKAHRAQGWEDDEPLFVMTNAPATSRLSEAVDWEAHEKEVMDRLRARTVLDAGDDVVWRRTPAELAERFPCSRGSLYGRASNSRWSAFRRPPNRVPGVDGLYLAGGSAHPGGGLPLCLQSGRRAAAEVIGDLDE